MKKDLYTTMPLDDLERDLLDDKSIPTSVKDLQAEKHRFQDIAQWSILKRQLLNDMMKDSEFDSFLKTLSDDGLNIQETFHNFFHKVVNGSISTKQLSN